MNKLLVFFSICMLGLSLACTTTPKQSSQEEVGVPTQPTATDTISQTTSTHEPSSTETHAADTNTAPASKGTTPVSGSEQTSTLTPESNTPVTQQATLLQDTKQFKDEDLIPLQDRLLNPLINSPVSTAAQTAPWKNEQLKYGVYYSFIKAGTAYIKNRGLVDIDGHPAYLIQTSAFSATVIDAVFKVRDINYSWIDATDFYSRGYTQSLREGNYKRDEWVIFDYDKNTYYGEIKKKAEARALEGSLSQKVLDMLSALYYVRVHSLEPGQEVVFDIINREEQYPLIVKVLGRETVKTNAGKFKCIVVEPKFRGEGIFVSKGKSLKVWLTDDKYKMPVKMKAEVFIGSVSAELLEYKRN